jgi:hypothetical protein
VWVNYQAEFGQAPNFYTFSYPFSLDAALCALQYLCRMEFGSSFCRVTGVSSLNLARRLKRLAGFFRLGSGADTPAAILMRR